MRKLIVTLMASLLSCSAAFAFWPEATDSSLEIGVGYRKDRFEWKTANHFDSSYGDYFCKGLPDKLSSHLKWRDLQIWLIEVQGKYVTCDNLYLRFNADYGWITHGKNTDSDFITLHNDSYNCEGKYSDFEFAHSKSKVKGHVYDARIAIGYQFRLCDDSFALSPLLGWSWHGKHLNDRHLKESIHFDDNTIVFDDEQVAVARAHSASFSRYSSCSYDSYSSGRQHSRYHTRWNGPFIGFDFDYRFGCFCEADWELFGTYEFHWATYHARGHWQARNDLCDGFRHRAKNMYGHLFDIGIKWDFCECWTLALKGEFQWWWAEHGRDRAKIAEANCGNVRTDCFISQRLRDIKTQSAAIIVDLGMVF